MKYIRTAGGVYEVIEECFKPMEDNMVFIPQEGFTKILNQSDTIEELCDFCEIDYTDNIYEIYDLTREEYPKGFIENHITDGFIISVFVGLKTNKGLIYVAKMNEKGELVLL